MGRLLDFADSSTLANLVMSAWAVSLAGVKHVSLQCGRVRALGRRDGRVRKFLALFVSQIFRPLGSVEAMHIVLHMTQ